MTLPGKNHVAKISKSIDRICAKLQLNVDGVSASTSPITEQLKKFVDLDDVKDKQKTHFNIIDTKKFFDINGNSVKSTTTLNAKGEDKFTVEKMTDCLSADGMPLDEELASVKLLPTGDSSTRSTNTPSECSTSESYSERLETGDVTMENKNGEFSSKIHHESSPGGNSDHTRVTDQKSDDDKSKTKARHTTQYNNWHYTDMLKAINAVQSKNLSMTAAAKKYQIPRTTLRHYLNDGTNRDKRIDSFSLPPDYENDLVHFVLENRNMPEKVLYKMIFEKAKSLSQLTSKGSEKKRHAPTPAWIRRFVYRHKQLYDFFPTCLTRFEHPLHGGKKIINGGEDPIINDCESSPCDNSSASIRGDTHLQVSSTEIIFPSYDHRQFDVNKRLHENETGLLSYEGRRHVEERQKNEHILPHCHDRQEGRFNNYYPSFSRFDRYSMVVDNNEDTYRDHIPDEYEANRRHKESFHEKIDRNSVNDRFQDCLNTPEAAHERYDRIISDRLKLPDTRQSSSMVLHHPSDKNIQSNSCSPSSHFLRTGDSKDRHSLTGFSSVPLVGTSSPLVTRTADNTALSPPVFNRKFNTSSVVLSSGHLTNDFPKNHENISEVKIAHELLEAMEKRLDLECLLIFQERYAKNPKVERLYSKWVELKCAVDCFKERERIDQ